MRFAPLKLGAKNWLRRPPDAGPRLANLFTLVENACQSGVDIDAYLVDLLTRLPASSIRRLSDRRRAAGNARGTDAR
jgi:hypothetical protein